MARQNALCFQEGRFVVKTPLAEEEQREAYRLRHRVYTEALRWVPASGDDREVDPYDAWATPVGVFADATRLVGFSRVLMAPGPFMIEAEFKSCLTRNHEIRKTRDTAEITRLTVDPSLGEKGLSSRVLLAAIKGLYQLLIARDVRYCYMVIEKRFLRVLKSLGFPCQPISEGVALPPAGVVSIAALLDLERFRNEASMTHPAFLQWITSLTGAGEAAEIAADSLNQTLVAPVTGPIVGSVGLSGMSPALRADHLVKT